MRDRVTPPLNAFDAFHSPDLSPAEGLDSNSNLFTAPPIESLEILSELGIIAAKSLRIETPLESTPELPKESTTPSKNLPPTGRAGHSDARLLEALLEYHRLRGPKLGAKTAPRPSGESHFTRTDSTLSGQERFSSIEIPVIDHLEPKPSTQLNRSSRPIQSILKPKTRP